MKIKVKVWLIMLLVVAVCLAAYVGIKIVYSDENTPPVIHCPSESITVSIHDGEDVLLQGVTASDYEDGDLTPNVMVEGVSKFFETGKSRVTYAVVDSDNSVTKYVREVVYSDYTSPYFKLNGALNFIYGTTFDISDYISAYDCIDGDISDKIEISLIGNTVDIANVGQSSVEFTVTNSKGDTISLPMTVTVTQKTTLEKRYEPVIYLNSYLTYLNVGDSFTNNDALANLQAVIIDGATIESGIVKQNIYINSNVNTAEAGKYTVAYEYMSDTGYVGTTELTVVVR